MVAQCVYVSNPASPASGMMDTRHTDPECRSNRVQPGCALQLPSTQPGCTLQLPSTQPGCTLQLSQDNKDQDQEPADNEDAADGVGIPKSDHQQILANESIDDSDGDGDGELIIDDEEDDEYVSPPRTGSGSATDKIETPTVVLEREQNVNSSARHRNGMRNEAQQKMEEGKQWLTKSLMFVSTALSVVKLSSVEEAYQTYCKETEKEPLTTPVLARLIRGLFPGAVKCRLGSRGSQRIHYRNLQLKTLMLQSQSSVQMSESLKKPGHLYETSTSINVPVNDCASLTVEATANISEQEEIQLREDCVKEKEDSKELIVPDEGDDKQQKNLGAAGEKSEEKQEGKVFTTEAPNQKNLKPQITIDDDQEECQPAADRLSQVLRWISSQGRKDVLLRDFAHSASCHLLSCTPLCLMFRRIRRHVVAARHSCSVLRIYSVLLRLHVSSCNNSDCGLPACPALRATKPVKRSLGQQGNPSKRSAVQRPSGVLRPSTLVLAPRSPATSLPGSPVNSPPGSPEHFLHASDLNWLPQTGQVQYVIVPVMPVVMPLSDNRGA